MRRSKFIRYDKEKMKLCVLKYVLIDDAREYSGFPFFMNIIFLVYMFFHKYHHCYEGVIF